MPCWRAFRGSCRGCRRRLVRGGPGGCAIDRRMGPSMSVVGVLGDVATPRTIRFEGRAVKPKTTTSWVCFARATTTCCGFVNRGVSTLKARSSTLAARFSTKRGGAVHGRGAGCAPGFHRGRCERVFSMGEWRGAWPGARATACPARRRARPARAQSPSNPRREWLRRPRTWVTGSRAPFSRDSRSAHACDGRGSGTLVRRLVRPPRRTLTTRGFDVTGPCRRTSCPARGPRSLTARAISPR